MLAKWHVKDGDIVKKDQPLFELETDKITSEGTAEAAGKISLQVAAGTEVKIGQVVASIDTAAAGAASASLPAPAATAAAAPTIENPKSKIENPQSPAVRRLAAETGVDPAKVEGSGKAGRVTKGDVLQVTQGSQGTAAPAPATARAMPKVDLGDPGERPEQRVPMSRLRARIAERLVQSQSTAAILTTFN